MKKLMTALMVSLTASSVIAAGADMITVRYNCKPAGSTSKSVTMKVQMLQGGIAGLTQIRVTRTTLTKNSVQTYIVKQDKPIPGLAGGATVYHGQNGMSFSINQTTSPSMPRKATLVEENGNTTQLLCELNKSKS
ncbi:MAG: hypothetical protein NDI63_12175 [Pseudobdellovibrio sp.]|nr:hypothetical protein [Pseudobdellovibrio sp.]